MNSFRVEKVKTGLDKLELYEEIDVDILSKLIESNLLITRIEGTKEYKNEKIMLLAYKKKIRDGRVKVKYCLNKEIGYGRVMAQKSLSLGSFRRVIRYTLAANYYIDIDVENCHPRLLYQLCKNSGLDKEQYKFLKNYIYNRESCLEEIIEEYVVDRDTAKELFIRLLYFGKFESWCKDNDIENKIPLDFIEGISKELSRIGDIMLISNPELKILLSARRNVKASVCSYVLQEYERRVLECVYNYLKDLVGNNSVLCYDGLMIPKELYYEGLLLELKEQVKDKLGFRLNFVIKDMGDNFYNELIELKKDRIDDVYAAKSFIELMNGKIFKDNNVLYIFNDNNGIWEEGTPETIKYICSKLGEDMVFKEIVGTKTVEHNYSGCSKKQSGMLDYINKYVENSDTLNDLRDTSMRKLLFKDGIFDMDTFEFNEKFDPEILFLSSIPYNFKDILETPNEEAINEVQLKLFEDPFSLDLDHGKYLKQYIARSMALDYYIKKCLFGIGDSNTSKGTLTLALRNTFYGYVGEWDGNNLKYNQKDSRDVSLKLKFIMNFRGKRLMIGNEMSQVDGNKIDSTIIKKLASGGDEITIRALYSNEIQYINQAQVIILANDMPEVFPSDDALLKRLRYMKFTTKFVDNPTNHSEKKIDESFKKRWAKDKTLKNGMFWTIMRCWRYEVKDKKYWEPDCIIEETKEWLSDQTLLSVLKEKFDITYDEKDYVIFSDIREEMKELALSDTKLGRELTKLGFKTKNVTIKNKSYKVRLGLKSIDY